MVFFNYSTMQMAAKVVYYGPGLCGKTTNLHYIYGHTTGDSRGEMVSLETETDRTLFFDLLPIDVGQIAGFNTRIQLYTVPGQVFYNTTRKLVLKGVDGVVFVADSQRPMLQANVDSFRNLEENLAEMGLSLDTLPVVLQFNKRDLPDICTVEEMNAALNRGNWSHVEASAVTGMGVFETLKEISQVTLLSLKKRLGRPEAGSAGAPGHAAAAAMPVRADSGAARPQSITDDAAAVPAAAAGPCPGTGPRSGSDPGAAAGGPAPAGHAAGSARRPPARPAGARKASGWTSSASSRSSAASPRDRPPVPPPEWPSAPPPPPPRRPPTAAASCRGTSR